MPKIIKKNFEEELYALPNKELLNTEDNEYHCPYSFALKVYFINKDEGIFELITILRGDSFRIKSPRCLHEKEDSPGRYWAEYPFIFTSNGNEIYFDNKNMEYILEIWEN